MEEYFLANGEDARKKVATLLTIVRDATYDLLSDLYAPDKWNSKTIAELVANLTDHLQPKPTLIACAIDFTKGINKKESQLQSTWQR